MTTSVHWSRLHTAPPSPTERLLHPLAEEHGITLWIKRDDRLVLPTPDGDLSFCGNKWRKLKYNLSEAREKGCHTLLTFGGAYSNHLAAVAAAGVLFGFRTICIVRGERVEPLNPTLAWAEAHGMVLHFVTRSAYRAKEHHPEVQAVLARYPGAFVLPEGGTNEPALQGIHELAAELRGQLPDPPDIVAVSLGTGGTAAGLIQALPKTTRVQVYPALKGDFVPGMLAALLGDTARASWQVIPDYHFGGYAKMPGNLLDFIGEVEHDYSLPLDPVYTGKLCYGLLDRIRQGAIPPGSSVVMVHTGGLQGRPYK